MIRTVVNTSTILIALLGQQALAQPFTIELGIGYSETDPKILQIDSDQLLLSGDYYFAPVETKEGPLEQAAFIQRVNRLGLFYSMDDANLGSTKVSDSDTLGISGTYIHQDSGWFVAGELFNLDGSGNETGNASTDLEGDGYQLTIGKYLLDNTALSLSYFSANTDSTTTITIPCTTIAPCPSFSNTFETENDGYAIDIKHLSQLGGYFYELRAGYIDVDVKTSPVMFIGGAVPVSTPVLTDSPILTDISAGDFLVGGGNFTAAEPVSPFFPSGSPLIANEADSSGYTLGASFYPLSSLAISLDYSINDSNALDSDTYGVGLQWFVMPSVAIEASYSETDSDDLVFITFMNGVAVENTISDFGDSKQFSLGAKVRF